MILNARMYSPTPALAELWRALLARVRDLAGGAPLELLDYPPPLPLGPLWARPDKAAVFMCGLPFSLAPQTPVPVAVPVPAPARYRGRAEYWSDLVVAADRGIESLEQTFGRRVALTTPESWSGFHALLQHLSGADAPRPPYRAAVGPTVTFLRNLESVARGDADVAPIDSYGLDLLRRHHPSLVRGVRVVASTAATSCPLLVGSSAHPRLRDALLSAHLDGECGRLMDALLLERFAPVDASRYAAFRTAHARGVRFWSEHPFVETDNPQLGFVDGGRLRAPR